MKEQNKPREIPMTPVESSQIAERGHDPETNTLALRFPGKGGKPGTVYHYQNFSAEDYAAFLAAESVGSYFIHYIKNRQDKHPYTKIS